MANVNSLTVGNTTLPVANSLASLSDVSTANTAEGNILTFNGTSWTNGTLTGNSGISVTRTGANYVLKGSTSWAQMQAINAPLTGLNTSQGGVVTAADTVLSAIGKIANDTGWITLQNDYFAGLKARKKNNIVFIEFNGSILQEIPSGNLNIASLPEGFNPTSYVSTVVGTHGNGQLAFGVGFVSPQGIIFIEFSAAVSNIYVDGSFCFAVD